MSLDLFRSRRRLDTGLLRSSSLFSKFLSLLLCYVFIFKVSAILVS
jgi:hypothetical protein